MGAVDGIPGSVQGLVALAGNEWEDEVKRGLENAKKAVIWRIKKPSGKSLVANQLKKLTAANGHFPLYLARDGKVTHRARVIGIAFPDDYDEKKSTWVNALDYKDDFDDYSAEDPPPSPF